MSNRVMLVTHNDLDAVGAEIIAKVVFEEENVDVANCKNPQEASEFMAEWLDNADLSKYEYVFIVDISINMCIAKRLDRMQHLRNKLYLLDHHETALELNQFEWATIKVENGKGVKECGTTLFYKAIKSLVNPAHSNSMEYFIGIIRSYDTWDWKENNDFIARDLNRLLYLIGYDEFVIQYIDWIKTSNNGDLYNLRDKTLLRHDSQKCEDYIKNKKRKIVDTTIGEHQVGVVFAEQYISELGNRISEDSPEFDYIAIINTSSGSVSLRTTGDVNVSNVAKTYGGGGHAKAGGFPLDMHDTINCIIETFLK